MRSRELAWHTLPKHGLQVRFGLAEQGTDDFPLRKSGR